MTAVDEAQQAHDVGPGIETRSGPRYLTGAGRYLADHAVPGLCHVAIARSNTAHARIVRINTDGAAALPGVVAVVTGSDLEAMGARRFDHLLGRAARPLTWPVLAIDRVRFVGEPYAAVVASSRALAEDALEAITAEFEELPPVVGGEAALAPGAPLLYPEWGTNVFLSAEELAPGLDEAIARAPRRLTERFESHRVCGLPIEGHGAQATWDPGTARLTVVASSQQPHQLRSVIAEICGLDETHVRVISPDIGGGFGNKQHFTREECLVGLLARLTGRPVRWSQDRTEALIASVHARAQVHEVEVGYDTSGRVLALKVKVISDLGNPVLYFSGTGPAIVTVANLSGGYAIDRVGWSLACVATTTCPTGAYRGFGQPEAHLTTERIMDLVASDLGMDPGDVRRVNLLPDSPRPWRGNGGQRIDVGSLDSQLDLLLERFEYETWRRRQAGARAEGRYVGVGISTLVQGTTPTQNDTAGRFGSLEMASLTILPDGHVNVKVGTKSQGQSHDTTFAQVAADALGIPAGLIEVRDGDTDALSYGQGTWGSRSAVMGGGAIIKAAGEVRAKLALVAAALGHHLPTEGAIDLDVYARVAAAAWWHTHLLPAGVEPGLTATTVYTPGFTGPSSGRGANHDETYASHATAAAVEVDPATGTVRVLSAVMVSDCGVVINRAIVEGQHQGGFTQGLGTAFLEESRYNDDGQPLCATLVDYTIPTALDVPTVQVVHRPTRAETTGGFRGAGEASIVVAPAVLVSAVEDALRPLGVKLNSTRLHPSVIRAAVRATGWRPDAAGWALRARVPGEL
ncbi:MAG TPA: xanthine dehydrogenase family protein molybdopterin-binding subunit [Acidimicrobiales bacterium]|jgi:carbon-monoxide dehydrogenase large subunit|nr:xanthine dehydrogenase family protein molybdopterin-binding subunit [Acidimicrobiales bacterium]